MPKMVKSLISSHQDYSCMATCTLLNTTPLLKHVLPNHTLLINGYREISSDTVDEFVCGGPGCMSLV